MVKVKVSILVLSYLFLVSGCASIKHKKPESIPAPQTSKKTSVSPQQHLKLPQKEPACNKVYRTKNGKIEYLIGPGDELEITLREGQKERKLNAAITPEGNINLGYLGSIPVNGKTLTEIKAIISRTLSAFVKEANVEVAMSKYGSKRVSIMGEINKLARVNTGPGIYFLSGKESIIELLCRAGGTTKDADLKNVFLNRRGIVYRLDLLSAMTHADSRFNVILDDGDLIYIPTK